MVAVSLTHNPTATAAFATALSVSAGSGGTTSAVTGSATNFAQANVWDIDLACPVTDVVSVTAISTYLKSAGIDPNGDGAAIFVGYSGGVWGTPSATFGDVVVPFLPGAVSRDLTGFGGTVASSGDPIGGTWSGGPATTTLQIGVYVDASSTPTIGDTIDVPLPTVDVVFTVGSPCAVTSPEPVPVDNAASGTVGTAAVVDVSLNDNNVPCDPLPGCAVYNTTVVIDPLSTAGGITASVDSAGIATVNATSAGTAIVTIESGCSPTCDPLGADVTVWVPQTLTVTFSEPTVPCAAQLVKTCLAETPIVGCAEYAGVPAPTVLHSVTGANGDVIPVGSVAHPAINGVGSDGSGFIRSYYTDIDGTVVAPDAGTFTPGDCPTAIPSTAFTAGGVAIGSGVHAATLGPDGTSWSAPTGLRSLTVAARKTSTTDVTGSAVNRIDVVLNGGTFRLLEGETFTWSVDDPDSIVAGSVNCVGDAAAAVVWVAI